MPIRRLSTEPREAAEAYFERWTGASAARAAAFPDRVAAAGGPGREVLDGSPASLVAAWDWIRGHAERVPAVPADAELPEWAVPGPPSHRDFELSPATLWLLDGLVHYFSAMLLAEVEGLRWELHVDRRRREVNVDHHHAVLVSEHVHCNPLVLVGQTYVALEAPDDIPVEKILRLYATHAGRPELLRR